MVEDVGFEFRAGLWAEDFTAVGVKGCGSLKFGTAVDSYISHHISKIVPQPLPWLSKAQTSIPNDPMALSPNSRADGSRLVGFPILSDDT